MSTARILGIVILVVGVILVIFGLQATNSPGEGLVHGVTGHYTDRTTWYIIGGVAALIAGGALTAVGGGRHGPQV